MNKPFIAQAILQSQKDRQNQLNKETAMLLIQPNEQPLLMHLLKLSEIIQNTQAYLKDNAGLFFPHNKALLINACMFVNQKYRDDVFTNDEIKKLITKVVNDYQQISEAWFLDIDSSTSKNIMLKNELTKELFKLPVKDIPLMMHYLNA
jgi:hypothetical protein